MQLHHQPGVPLHPQAIAKAQSIHGLEPHHVGHQPRHPLLTHQLRGIELGRGRAADHRHAREKPGRIAPIRAHHTRLWQKSTHLIVAPKNSARRAAQRLHPLHLLKPIAGMPDARAGHGSVGRHHHKHPGVGFAARRTVHALNPLRHIALGRDRYGLRGSSSRIAPARACGQGRRCHQARRNHRPTPHQPPIAKDSSSAQHSQCVHHAISPPGAGIPIPNSTARGFKGGIAQKTRWHLQCRCAAKLLVGGQQFIQTGIPQHHLLPVSVGHSHHGSP